MEGRYYHYFEDEQDRTDRISGQISAMRTDSKFSNKPRYPAQNQILKFTPKQTLLAGKIVFGGNAISLPSPQSFPYLSDFSLGDAQAKLFLIL